MDQHAMDERIKLEELQSLLLQPQSLILKSLPCTLKIDLQRNQYCDKLDEILSIKHTFQKFGWDYEIILQIEKYNFALSNSLFCRCIIISLKNIPFLCDKTCGVEEFLEFLSHLSESTKEGRSIESISPPCFSRILASQVLSLIQILLL